jgi:hypothetical protein
MKRIVLMAAAAALGLSAPAIASAQSFGGLGQIVQAQYRFADDRKDDRGRGRRDDRGREDNRGGDNRGNGGGRPREEDRGPPPNRGGGGYDPRYRIEAPPPQVYQQPPRGRPNPYAQPGESWRAPGGPTGGEISMSQAIRIVQGLAGPGHHLDGQREERGGRTYYRIQWATDRGERRDYYIDAQTGALVGR